MAMIDLDKMLEKIKGMTLAEASALIKEVDSTFGVGDSKKDGDDDGEEAASEE